MKLDIRTRIVRLGMTNRQICKMISTDDFHVHQAQLSAAIHGSQTFPKHLRIRNEVLNLLTKLERERGLDD